MATKRLTTENFVAVLATLTPFELDVLETVAQFYMPVRTSTLADVLQNRGARDDKGRGIRAETLKPALDRLKAAGFLRSSSSAWVCDWLFVERITRNMVAAGRFNATEPMVREAVRRAAGWGSGIDIASPEQIIASVRLPLYKMDFVGLDKILDAVMAFDVDDRLDSHPISTIIGNPFDPHWLETFPAAHVGKWLGYLLFDKVLAGEAVEEVVGYIRTRMETFEPEHQQILRYRLADLAFNQGRFEEMQGLTGDIGLFGDLLRARHLLVRGLASEAVSLYDVCLSVIKQQSRKKKPKFPNVDGPYFVLALLQSGESNWPRALEMASWGATDRSYLYQRICEELVVVIRKELGEVRTAAAAAHQGRWGYNSWQLERNVAVKQLSLAISMWMDQGNAIREEKEVVELCIQAAENGYHWLEFEFASLLARGGSKGERYRKRADVLGESLGVHTLLDTIRPVEEWERTLKALLQVTRQDTANSAPQSQSRLAWMLTEVRGLWNVEPKEQKLSANGKWSKGRNISLIRFREESEEWDFLLPQDRAAREYVHTEFERHYWGRGDFNYHLVNEVFLALVGHPNVFMSDTGANVEVVAAKPELQVTAAKGSFTIKLIPEKPQSGNIRVERRGDSRIAVYEYTPELGRIAEILGKELKVPAQGKDAVLQAVRNVSSLVTVHSDIGVGDESIPQVDADATPIVQLLPSGEGLLVHLRVRPLPEGGPVFAPAAGGEVVLAEVNGARMQASRNFALEKKESARVVDACPTLSAAESGDREWYLDSPEAALEFLLELEKCAPQPRIEWPKGQKYAIQGSAGMGQFRARINAGNNWFELSGEVQVNQELVLNMQRLLELTEGTKSRFVALGDGQFLALTHAFRKKLDELRGVGEANDDGLRMHALAAPLMDDLLAQANSVKVNKKWKEQVQRLQESRDLDPEIPPTLRATLRDYQVDGFKWLARLAEWGVGACLADDMGLGKTVQLLALMLRRASGGPQLVIAPTSVCANWESEAARFSPTLKVHRMGTFNRQETVSNLGAYDVLICSYGLLQSENDLLKQVEWQTIVLDEAQSIKNTASKRSKAAMELKGNFKVASTGTPIENHLGELWNLYRFINPGFLGSLEQFNGRFALPIEKFENRDAGRHLKQLIQPFILRRRKEEVLDELPARTDIVLHVELGDGERAFYEALRLRALKQLSEVKGTPGKNHVRILAEIMRLRRACCNSRLVEADSGLPSAKLEVFEALLDELLENRHQALVFSQFVGHLDILRELLDRKGVAYQYLDGSTPAAARKKAVDAFQAGEGDVFLISLKAGGLGLNLTAADYVIHMDPWWNPAVEDQASDRAHRIGQLRPVTVYRLVAKNTIEDQITDLHHRKRDLANSLLEGADMAGKISSEELLELLRMG